MVIRKRCAYPIGAVLPHEPPMILLDEVLDYDEAGLRAAVTITPSSPFIEPEGVQAYMGLEYMAQACGAHAGALARDAGDQVRVGFLLGTRRYRSHVPRFCIGDRLTVSAALIYRDDEMGTFDCRIEANGQCVAEARLNVFQPRPDHPLLKKSRRD
jgi:predicted hotdog family 3-hydroxylacyl-ACP dehydratase